jgi:hypothetical protein
VTVQYQPVLPVTNGKQLVVFFSSRGEKVRYFGKGLCFVQVNMTELETLGQEIAELKARLT